MVKNLDLGPDFLDKISEKNYPAGPLATSAQYFLILGLMPWNNRRKRKFQKSKKWQEVKKHSLVLSVFVDYTCWPVCVYVLWRTHRRSQLPLPTEHLPLLTTGAVLLSGQSRDSAPAISHGSPSPMEKSHILTLLVPPAPLKTPFYL